MVVKYFGTDGVRGRSNKYPLTAEFALKLGMASAVYFNQKAKKITNRVIIGKDPRLSGYLFENAITAGLLAMGKEVFLLGPMPTPGVAFLTKSMRADFGVMISASHNPYYDNGIKLFDSLGFKLKSEEEKEIESYLEKDLELDLVAPDKIGRAFRLAGADGRYMQYIKGNLPSKLTLKGLKIVVDCANGASYKIAPNILYELGVDKIIPLGVNPNGLNINDKSGSTYINNVISKVLETGANLGIAFDGDADRVIMVDEKGNIVDGDSILGIIAADWLKKGKLRSKKVVGTIMTNLGLEKYLQSLGIELIRTNVGDKYILEALLKNNLEIGGESSGHIVLKEYNTTGDGMMSALEVIKIMLENQVTLSKLSGVFKKTPQIINNLKITDANFLNNEDFKKFIKEKEQEVNTKARILIRKSGTEPLIRIMVEGDDEDLINNLNLEIQNYITNYFNKLV